MFWATIREFGCKGSRSNVFIQKSKWYRNQLSNNDYIYKYSGGMAVYPANHRPFAVYSPEVEKTFFVLEVLILTI